MKLLGKKSQTNMVLLSEPESLTLPRQKDKKENSEETISVRRKGEAEGGGTGKHSPVQF